MQHILPLFILRISFIAEVLIFLVSVYMASVEYCLSLHVIIIPVCIIL